MARVLEINDMALLGNYAAVWSRLFAKTPNATFFQTLDWLEIYWKHFGKAQRLRVLLVEVDSQVVGILPLVEKREMTKAGPVTVLTYPLDSWGPHFGPIGDLPTATLYAAFQYLAGSNRAWDLLDLRWINPALDRGRTANAMRCHGMTPALLPWDGSYAVELNQFDQYLEHRSAKFRKTVRRKIRHAERVGIRFQRYRPAGVVPGNEAPDMLRFEACVELAARTWQGQSETGTTLSHDSVRHYFRDCFMAASCLGMMDLATLERDGRILAFVYNLHHAGRVLGLRIGYDPDFPQLSLGTVLMGCQIRDSCQRGDTLLDLGPGHLEVKRRWITHELPAQRVCHYASRSLSARVLRWGHWWKYMHMRPTSKSIS